MWPSIFGSRPSKATNKPESQLRKTPGVLQGRVGKAGRSRSPTKAPLSPTKRSSTLTEGARRELVKLSLDEVIIKPAPATPPPVSEIPELRGGAEPEEDSGSEGSMVEDDDDEESEEDPSSDFEPEDHDVEMADEDDEGVRESIEQPDDDDDLPRTAKGKEPAKKAAAVRKIKVPFANLAYKPSADDLDTESEMEDENEEDDDDDPVPESEDEGKDDDGEWEIPEDELAEYEASVKDIPGHQRWLREERRMHKLLSLRGLTPLMPASWKKDFLGTPIHANLFAPLDSKKPVVIHNLGSQFRGELLLPCGLLPQWALQC
jgi:hypothetical protein